MSSEQNEPTPLEDGRVKKKVALASGATVTIEGSEREVTEIVASLSLERRPALVTRRQRRLAARREQQKRINYNRNVVHRGYLIAKKDPELKQLADRFLSALTGPWQDITDELVESAEMILPPEQEPFHDPDQWRRDRAV